MAVDNCAHCEIEKGSRKESHNISVDTITCDGAPLSTRNGWRERLNILARTSVLDDFAELDACRVHNGQTLGLVRPSRIVGLDITAAKTSEWTKEERAKLLKLQQQGNLFDETDRRSVTTLKKVPYDFHYRYVCSGSSGSREYKHKIVDWEIGALYWNVCRSHGKHWEKPFRAKLEQELLAKDLMFLLGTIHRFPDQWLIASLIYPPKRRTDTSNQLPLL